MLVFFTYFLYIACLIVSIILSIYIIKALGVVGIFSQIIVGFGYFFLIFLFLFIASTCLLVYLSKIEDTLIIKRENKKERELLYKQLMESKEEQNTKQNIN